jgi:metal-dependent amidase/aminoacylase/carboxypeptidase family protein
MLAAGDVLSVTVHGPGGHGSEPHRAKDPILAACAMVSALQVTVTRQFDVFDPVVITVGTGAFVLLGACARGADPESAANNHSPAAVFDDGVLADGAALYTELALRRLAARPVVEEVVSAEQA